MRLIKRYNNRKLYDTTKSGYVTLNQLAELIGQGEELKVVENTTERDITVQTLALIVFEQTKKTPDRFSSVGLTNLVRLGLSLGGVEKKSTETIVDKGTHGGVSAVGSSAH